jgi:hypothetical protein
MNNIFFKSFTLIIIFFSISANSANLSDDAKNRGISESCYMYLNQIEKSFDLNGFNITFAHPENPSIVPSHHISLQKYDNGSSVFSATLSSDGETCNHSTVVVTSISDQSCYEIAKQKIEINPSLQSSSYADGGFITLNSSKNSFQTILTSSGERSCTIIEARMIWPEK